MNKGTPTALLVAFLLGAGTYAIKQKVIDLNVRLEKLQCAIAQHKEAIHILSAEWTYLTRPERLQALIDQRHALHQTTGLALVSYKDVFEPQEPRHTQGITRLVSMR
jgi:hypothetical protein